MMRMVARKTRPRDLALLAGPLIRAKFHIFIFHQYAIEQPFRRRDSPPTGPVDPNSLRHSDSIITGKLSGPNGAGRGISLGAITLSGIPKAAANFSTPHEQNRVFTLLKLN